MQYALLIYDDPKSWESVGEDELAAIMQEFVAVGRQAAGGERLRPVNEAKTVRVSNGDRLVTDGPFAETKEQLGGFYIVDADSEEKALALAAQIPSARMGGSVEVRPIWEM